MPDTGAVLAENPAAEPASEVVVAAPADDLANDVLVEEVSIDGMCGVY